MYSANRTLSTQFTSNGIPIPFVSAYFKPLAAADSKDPTGWKRAYEENGYLYLPGILNREEVLNLREAYMNMFDPAIFKEGTTRREGVFSGKFQFAPAEHGHTDHPASKFVQQDAFRLFTGSKELKQIAELLMASEVVQLKRKPLRHFYKGTMIASKAHCDYTYLNDGTENLLSFWIPLGDISMETGGLLYLEQSHHLNLGQLREEVKSTETTIDQRPIAKDLQHVSDVAGLPWLYADFKAGDIVIHNPFIVHASLDCCTDLMRLSTDLRFVKANDPVDPRWLESWRGDDGY